MRPALAPSRWAGPEPPRAPKEPDPPDLLGTILWWGAVAGTLGTGVGTGAGKVVDHLYGPRRGPWEAEMPAVVEERLRAQLGVPRRSAGMARARVAGHLSGIGARGSRGNRAGNRLYRCCRTRDPRGSSGGGVSRRGRRREEEALS